MRKVLKKLLLSVVLVGIIIGLYHFERWRFYSLDPETLACIDSHALSLHKDEYLQNGFEFIDDNGFWPSRYIYDVPGVSVCFYDYPNSYEDNQITISRLMFDNHRYFPHADYSYTLRYTISMPNQTLVIWTDADTKIECMKMANKVIQEVFTEYRVTTSDDK